MRSIELEPARLAGLPEDFIAAHPAGPSGKVKITTDYPDYNPFMMYADDDAARRELYVAFRSRGDKDNEALLAQVLALRDEKASLLGYDTFADFIERVAKLAQARAKRDYNELLKELKTIDKKAVRVEDWQKTYLENRVKLKKYKVDSKEVRPYFPYDQTLAGLLDITSTIYDIQYAPVSDATVWHPDVKVFDVMRGAAKLGRIYLDMHPREGKYKHAAQFTLHDGVEGVQLPEGVLVCNFPRGNELMEHDDVVTTFHEFGHLMHHVLGGNQTWIRHSGVATEHDFVEAPSQMFENWVWDPHVLGAFARHYRTDEPLPRELLDNMIAARNLGSGMKAERQIYYGLTDQIFHTAPGGEIDTIRIAVDLFGQAELYKPIENIWHHASFTHLIGYRAGYYGYLWSLVYAEDMFQRFKELGMLDPQAGQYYRKHILSRGGTRDGLDLVKTYLGREPSMEPFLRHLGLGE